MKHIAKIQTDFSEKFGVPRQSSLLDLKGKIVFEAPYRTYDCVNGLEEFSHIWLLWEFSEHLHAKESLTARPPRLGGNIKKGVFATRSPFRPNPIGLSLVKLEKIVMEEEGPILYVSGVDMLNGTPIYDIKPYLPYTESVVDAKGGFTDNTRQHILNVEAKEGALDQLSKEDKDMVIKLIAQDPRPGYQNDPERVYGMKYKKYDIQFLVKQDVAMILKVKE